MIQVLNFKKTLTDSNSNGVNLQKNKLNTKHGTKSKGGIIKSAEREYQFDGDKERALKLAEVWRDRKGTEHGNGEEVVDSETERMTQCKRERIMDAVNTKKRE